jgi:hypothetical protein
MGAWGPALFSDDFACDIRDNFKELIGDGLTAQQATEQLVEAYEDEIIDSEDGPVFWLSLASIQWSTGRLIGEVKQKALAIIEDGVDLLRWSDDKKQLERRKLVLEKLKAQLQSPQSQEKKLPKVYKENSPYSIGDIFSYKHKTGNIALLRVIDIHQDNGGRFPVCELLDFFEEEVNSDKDFSSMPIREIYNPHAPITQFVAAEVSARYAPKEGILNLVATNSKPAQKSAGYSVLFWRDMDNHLATAFGKK